MKTLFFAVLAATALFASASVYADDTGPTGDSPGLAPMVPMARVSAAKSMMTGLSSVTRIETARL